MKRKAEQEKARWKQRKKCEYSQLFLNRQFIIKLFVNSFICLHIYVIDALLQYNRSLFEQWHEKTE